MIQVERDSHRLSMTWALAPGSYKNRKYFRPMFKWASSSAQAITIVPDHIMFCRSSYNIDTVYLQYIQT